MSKDELLAKYSSSRQKCDVFTRVMGYLRPISSYNIGKKQEAKERMYYTVDETFKNKAYKGE